MDFGLTDFSSLKHMDKFKANTHVLARFANAFDQKSSLKKTQLHFVSRLSWKSFDNYLKWLENNEYVEFKISEKKQTYRLTERGIKMFKIILQLHSEIDSYKQKTD